MLFKIMLFKKYVTMNYYQFQPTVFIYRYATNQIFILITTQILFYVYPYISERYKTTLINHQVYFNNLTQCLQEKVEFQKIIVFQKILRY